jgi:hypothetical protein
MASYQLMTLQHGFVMDVAGAIAEPGTDVIAYTPWPQPRPNQFWTFEGPEGTGSYYIKSEMPHDLVLSATGGTGTTLEVSTPQSPLAASQLWRFVPAFLGFPAAGFIQSVVLDPADLLVTSGTSATPGTNLEVQPQNLLAGASQLWWLLPKHGNQYDPQIPTIVPARLGFTITGTGFQAGTSLFATYELLDINTGQAENGSFFAITDFGGNFVSEGTLTNLFIFGPGSTLQINIFLSFPEFPYYIEATWDGSAFTNIQLVPK